MGRIYGAEMVLVIYGAGKEKKNLFNLPNTSLQLT